MALDYESIGRHIKQYRTDKKMSQEELSHAVFVNYEHISRIEGGKVRLSLELLVLIADVLGVSADDLLVDTLKHPSSLIGTEFYKLLLDCNNDEKAILTKTVKFLKTTLAEHGI